MVVGIVGRPDHIFMMFAQQGTSITDAPPMSRISNSTRRRVLQLCGASVVSGLAGCSSLIDNDGSDDIQDTDGDGVIDSEDYAPRDSSVQRAEQVEEASSPDTEGQTRTETATERQPSSDTPTPASSSVRYRDNFSYNSYQSHWTIREGHDGSIISVDIEDGQLVHIVDGGSVGGNIVSNQSFDSSATVKIEAELVRRLGGGGFGIHFGEYGTESSVLIGDGENSGLFYTVFPSDDRRGIVVDSEPGPENTPVTYSLTLDFNNQTLQEISRDGRAYSLRVNFGDVFSDFFKIEIGNGRNHRIEYNYVEIK